MTMTSGACVMLAASIFLFPACSGTSDPGDELAGSGAAGRILSGGTGLGGTGAGSGGAGGGSSSAGASGAAGMASVAVPPPCNDLVLDAPGFVLKSAPGTAPAATGGSIVDGTYFITGATLYGQSLPDVPFGRTKVQISGGSWQDVENVDSEPGGVNPDEHYTYSFTSAGTSLTLSRSCPAGGQSKTLSYSAEGGQLTVFVLDHGAMFVSVLTRQ